MRLHHSRWTETINVQIRFPAIDRSKQSKTRIIAKCQLYLICFLNKSNWLTFLEVFFSKSSNDNRLTPQGIPCSSFSDRLLRASETTFKRWLAWGHCCTLANSARSPEDWEHSGWTSSSVCEERRSKRDFFRDLFVNRWGSARASCLSPSPIKA